MSLFSQNNPSLLLLPQCECQEHPLLHRSEVYPQKITVITKIKIATLWWRSLADSEPSDQGWVDIIAHGTSKHYVPPDMTR